MNRFDLPGTILPADPRISGKGKEFSSIVIRTDEGNEIQSCMFGRDLRKRDTIILRGKLEQWGDSIGLIPESTRGSLCAPYDNSPDTRISEPKPLPHLRTGGLWTPHV